MFDFWKSTSKNTQNPFLCNQLKQFGFCDGPCLDRHYLNQTLDKPRLDVPNNSYIRIQLIQIHSASHYHGRVIKYSITKDPTEEKNWISVDLFTRVKDELKIVNVNSKVVYKNPVVGEMVMVEIKSEFHRAVVLDIIYGWVSLTIKVKLIDYGRVEEISSSKVFILPDNLKEFCPAAVEIIVSSMKPISMDFIPNWPVTTTNRVRRLLEPIILGDLELTCKVNIVLGTTVWIDSMFINKCTKCSHFGCNLYKNSLILPKELIEQNFAEPNSQIIYKLTNLNKDANVWIENEIIEIPKSKAKTKVIEETKITLFSSEKNKIENKEVIKPQWTHLSENMVHDVEVNFTEHPKCILVRNLKFDDIMRALQKDIDEAVDKKTVEQLTCFSVGTVCLARSPSENKYNRALIKTIDDDQNAILFYVDYGEFYLAKTNTLLTISSWLITKLPFQIIECSLSGFKDISQTDNFDEFNDRLLQITDTTINLKVLSISPNTYLTEGNCHEVVLFNKDLNVNTTLSKEFDTLVDNIQMQIILNTNYEAIEYANIIDEDYDDDDKEDLEIQYNLLEALLKMPSKIETVPTVSNSINLISQDKIINNGCTENDKITLNNQNMPEKKNVSNKKKYCIECNAKSAVPLCLWHQDETWLYLKFNILSPENYKITHSIDTITLTAETNAQSFFITISLFAFIFEESLNYHERFDGIHIKVKKIFKCESLWPRLVKCSEKHKYIIYDTEYLMQRKNWGLWAQIMNKYKMTALNQPFNNLNNDDIYDSSDSENEQYAVFED